MKPKVTGVAETFLIPLWARAVETKRSGGIIKDPKSVEIMDAIDYDFNRFEGAKMSQVGVSIRTMLLDNATKVFIEKHPHAVMVNIGAGLDTRFSRVDNGKILWYDLDLPESIEVRRQFFSDTDRCKMIAKSVFDFTWIDDIKSQSRPILFLAEGIFMYFDEHEVQQLLSMLHKSFTGSQMLFETLSVLASKNTKRHDVVNTTSAVFKWGVDHATDVEKLTHGIRVLNQWSFFKNLQKGQGNLMMKMICGIPVIEKKMSSRIFHLQL